MVGIPQKNLARLHPKNVIYFISIVVGIFLYVILHNYFYQRMINISPNRSWYYFYVLKVSCVAFTRIQPHYHIFRDERLHKIETMLQFATEALLFLSKISKVRRSFNFWISLRILIKYLHRPYAKNVDQVKNIKNRKKNVYLHRLFILHKVISITAFRNRNLHRGTWELRCTDTFVIVSTNMKNVILENNGKGIKGFDRPQIHRFSDKLKSNLSLSR